MGVYKMFSTQNKNILLYMGIFLLMMLSGDAIALSKAIIFAYDYNLGFPASDPKLNHFFSQHHIQIQPYTDMSKMIVDLNKHTITAALIPAGVLYYLKDDANFKGIASATVGENRQLFLKSYLIVKKTSPITTIKQLHGKKIAYANEVCTSSFFAPKLFLNQYHIVFSRYFSKYVKTYEMPEQIQALLTDKVDTTMVWDRIYFQNANTAKETRIIGQSTNLPTPVVILNVTTNNSLKAPLTKALQAYQPSLDSKFLFTGFTDYQNKLVQDFLQQLHCTHC